MTNYNTLYSKIKEITQGNYSLSCSEPLTEVKDLLSLIIPYNPLKEENSFLRNRAIEQLKKWERDLILGGCRK